jgi:hypothetical protein
MSKNYKKKVTLQEIVENQEKHILLIPRSEEDQEYLDQLASKIVKNVPDDILIEKCKLHLSGFEELLNTDYQTSEEKMLNLVCMCHNCDAAFPVKNIKWIHCVEDGDVDKWSNMLPVCTKYPICPSSWSYFDLWLKNVKYNIDDHRKGRYTIGNKKYSLG